MKDKEQKFKTVISLGVYKHLQTLILSVITLDLVVISSMSLTVVTSGQWRLSQATLWPQVLPAASWSQGTVWHGCYRDSRRQNSMLIS